MGHGSFGVAQSANRDIALFIDPVSHHFQNDALFDRHSTRLNGDQILEPYSYLRDQLTQRGISVHTADYLLRGEHCRAKNIYASMGLLNHYPELAQRSDVVLSAFFALECPIVEPTLYRALTQVQKSFKRIFSFSDATSLQPFLRSAIECHHFFIPQSFDTVHEALWQQSDRQFMVMINANKLPRLYLQELYTERLRAVEFFNRTDDIDLYGVGWDLPPYQVGKTWVPYTLRALKRNLTHHYHRLYPDPLLEAARRAYKGKAQSKSETLGHYTFALCFENSILKGWITEKIFDCFFAGTIPIYWGAPDVQDYIPAHCFIDMRNFADYADLKNYLKSLTSSDIQGYKQRAREFLQSKQFYPFSKYAFVDLFCQLIQEDTDVELL